MASTLTSHCKESCDERSTVWAAAGKGFSPRGASSTRLGQLPDGTGRSADRFLASSRFEPLLQGMLSKSSFENTTEAKLQFSSSTQNSELQYTSWTPSANSCKSACTKSAQRTSVPACMDRIIFASLDSALVLSGVACKLFSSVFSWKPCAFASPVQCPFRFALW